MDGVDADTLAQEDEYPSAVVLEGGDGDYVVGLWWLPAYQHAEEYADYLTGVRDEGFTEHQLHSVRLTACP